MKMLRLRCGSCDWEFDAVALPMEVTLTCNAVEAVHCPMCGNHAGNRICTPRTLTPDELHHKAGIVERAQRAPPPGNADEERTS